MGITDCVTIIFTFSVKWGSNGLPQRRGRHSLCSIHYSLIKKWIWKFKISIRFLHEWNLIQRSCVVLTKHLYSIWAMTLDCDFSFTRTSFWIQTIMSHGNWTWISRLEFCKAVTTKSFRYYTLTMSQVSRFSRFLCS